MDIILSEKEKEEIEIEMTNIIFKKIKDQICRHIRYQLNESLDKMFETGKLMEEEMEESFIKRMFK